MSLLQVYPRSTWTQNVYPISTRLKVKGIVLHHSDSSNVQPLTGEDEVKRVSELLRTIYQWHTNNNGWKDIGYHFVVSRSGMVFEARRGSALVLKDGLMVTGAHAPGKNSTHVGICLEGDYQQADLPNSLWESLVRLMAVIAHVAGFPLNRTTVLLHREVRPTKCPGDVVAAKAQAIVDHANRVLQNLKSGGK